MDAQTFLDNFATIAEAPDGVQRLRDLVLELAISGRLVEQLSTDEPASDLLDRLEKGSLVSSSNLTEPIGDEDTPWDLPGSWQWSRLKQVADFAAGRTPPTKDPSFWSSSDQGYHWVSIGDMPDGGVVTRTARKVSERAAEEIFRQEPDPPGTLLMSFKLTIGKVARLAVPAFHNEAIISVRTPLEEIGEYLFRTLPRLTQGGASKAAVMGNTLNRTSLTNLLVPVPPLAEQERIVATVDELLALCDDLEANQERRHRATASFRASILDALTNPTNDLQHAWATVSSNWPSFIDGPAAVEPLRESIRQLAVQGNLVEQRESDGEAQSDVERARARKLAIPGLRQQPPVAGATTAPALPRGWTLATVDDLFLVTGGIQKTSKRAPRLHHFPYLRVANVQRGRLDLSEIERFELAEGELDRLRLEPGDLLVVEGNGSESEIGRCARWGGEIGDCVHQNHLIRCRPMLPGVEHWLLLFLNSPAGITTMKDLAVTTSGLYNLSVAKIRAIRFPVPPMAEQGRISEYVDELMRSCDNLEDHLARRESIHGSLAASAVTIWS